MKCVNKWCKNEAEGYMCLRCEDIYYDAVMEAKEHTKEGEFEREENGE